MNNFSVLLSLYYKENPHYFNESLHSIYTNQTIKPAEIVLVIDGPLTLDLEKTVSLWKKALNEELVVVRLSKNQGLGIALNEGLKHCSHEWIFRMDTDDISIPYRFEKQLKFINSHPEISILGSNIIELNETGKIIVNKKKVPELHTDILKYAKYRNPFNHMTIAYKKSAVLSAEGYQHHLYMEDYNLWLRMLSNEIKGSNIQEALVYARTGQKMLGRRRGSAYVKSEIQLLQLKYKLGFTNLFSSIFIFCIRCLPRLLPVSFLSKVYTVLRK